MKLLLATLLGGLAIFVWGFLSWTVLPWHMSQYKDFKNEDAVRAVFDAQPETGVYQLPGARNPDGTDRPQKENMDDAMKRTMGFALVRPGATPRSKASFFIWGFVVCLLQALLLVLILNRVPLGFSCRVRISMLIGVFTGIASQGPNCNWFEFPIGYALPYLADYIIQGLLAGLIIAKFVQKPGDRC